jgi:hypothetical protein
VSCLRRVERGWNEQACAFTQAFGSEDLAASSLMLATPATCPATTRT